MAALLAVLGFVYMNQISRNNVRLFPDGEEPYLAVAVENGESRVRIWQDEEDGRAYFFLPSCVKHHRVRVDSPADGSVRMDGKLFEDGDVFRWEEDRTYQMQITDSDYEVRTYDVTFMKSENIPSVFIDTKSGSMDYLNADKANEETGQVSVVRADGNMEYEGKLERVSGRGNSTWEFEKKPYALKLSEKYPLCGLDKSDRWRLLALWLEGSKMDNKIAMDLAQELGLAYSTQGTWVDVYFNGEYAGIYLLTESVSVGDGRVDIYDLEKENKRYNKDIDSAKPYQEADNKGYLIENGDNITGGYLIEKDHPKHFEVEANGFVTRAGSQFTINAPRHVSKEQAEYIRDYVNEIEEMVLAGNPQVWDVLDIDSFAKRFLVDELALDTDVGLTSMFFYKERDDDKLYSGPSWDYDNAFGERNSDSAPGYDYTQSVVNFTENAPNVLNWYAKLYGDPQFMQCVTREYEALLPFFEELLDTGIDRYAEMIAASVKMDRVLWADKNILGDSSAKYPEYDDNVRYTKYFIAKRLNYLCGKWGGGTAHEPFDVPSNGEVHTVTFSNFEGIVDVREVMDGTEMESAPEYDGGIYQGWSDKFTGEKFRTQIPVYCDMEFYNAKWE